MVSKVAVIALVAIVACPILLGYGLNLTQTTVTEYKPNNTESVNVTTLLQNSFDYYTTNTDPVTINTSWGIFGKNYGVDVMPKFKTINSNYSSIQVTQYTQTGSWIPDTMYLHHYTYYDLRATYDASVGYLIMTITYNDSTAVTVNKVIAFNWQSNTGELIYYVSGVGRTVITNTTTIETLSFSSSGSYSANTMIHYDNIYWTHNYVDLSAGYYLPIHGGSYLHLPDYQSVILTVDLGSIADANYGFQFSSLGTAPDSRIIFIKTTDGDGVHWSLYNEHSGLPTTKITDLYYNQSSSSNTYQIYVDHSKTQLRYVGDWPTTIAPANYYKTYTIEPPAGYDNMGSEILVVRVAGESTQFSPLMRVDWSQYSSTKYSIIENRTYDPASFRNNPSTTINNTADGTPTRYGSTITFGGNTYNVTDGNITLGSHQVSLRNLTFASYPVAGGYENRIGGVTVSTTAQPSTITFGGKWNVSIATVAMEQNTYDHTEWTAGQFAWDGIDQNFVMIGLLVALGAFIALGIAFRKVKSALFALLVVCGGAAALFFTML